MKTRTITMSSLGQNGRLGNQLFQYASLIGLAGKYNANLVLPEWPYEKYFANKFPVGEIFGTCREVKEPVYHYVSNWPQIQDSECVDIYGHLQSEKYWKDSIEEVKRALTFKPEFVQQVRDQYEANNDELTNPIAISIRRGDYVNNPNYAQLPIVSYYFLALLEYFPDWRKRQIIIFSDDIPYCRVHFSSLENVTYSENNSEIEDLCLMSQCSDFIIANSTFSWWGAYLGKIRNPDAIVVRSKYHFAGRLEKKMDSKDLYPLTWITFDCKGATGQYKKLDFSDVTFTIPVSYDHEDRVENLNMNLRILQKNFHTTISVSEQSKDSQAKFAYLISPGSHFYCTTYSNIVMDKFHRTRILNLMAKDAITKFIFNWDADVIIPPIQLWQSVELLRAGADMVYPYRWAFARIPRATDKNWFVIIRNYEDIGMVGDTRFNGMDPGDAVSLGGAVGFNRESFIRGGMENENFISYGAEDVERWVRFSRLGFRIERALGPNLYHINHYTGPNSTPRHPDFANNDKEFLKIKRMTVEELQDYVKTFNWVSK